MQKITIQPIYKSIKQTFVMARHRLRRKIDVKSFLQKKESKSLIMEEPYFSVNDNFIDMPVVGYAKAMFF